MPSRLAWMLVLFFSPVAHAQVGGNADLYRDTRAILEGLIRLDTSNPPGNEILAARYLKERLDKASIPAQIYASTGTRASLIARLKGSGEEKPLILMCHIDVVPADPAEWSTDPFTPVEKEGYLYGRGSADVKSMCAAELSILLRLKSASTPLKRDLIFFAEADEESGAPDSHIHWLLREHGDALQAEFAINEGGTLLWDGKKVSELRIQTAEKFYLDLTLVARGSSGHASVPRPDNAVVHVAGAVQKIFQHRFAARLDPAVRGFLESQTKTARPELKTAIDGVLRAAAPSGSALEPGAKPGTELDRAADRLSEVDPEFGAMLRDTVTPTMLKGGYKSNVIPAEAEATLNARLMPGRRVEDLIAELRTVVNDTSVEIRYDPPTGPPVGAMPTDTALYRAAQSAASELAPSARVMPFMEVASTDSIYLRQRGVIAYGINPPLTEEDDERLHGKNERISLAGLDWYVRYLHSLVLKVAARG